MWNTVELGVVALVIICFTEWFRRWRNPKCNGVLPPGSMGFPLIGETLSLLIPSYSLDLHPFIKTRIQRYGPIFRTSVIGRPVVISADAELNKYLFSQEGREVELYYKDTTFTNVYAHKGESRINQIGVVHRYIRSILLNQFGAESLKEKLLPQIEELVNKTLSQWSSQDSVEVIHAASAMVVNFSAKQMISYDAEKSSTSLSEAFTSIGKGFRSIPLNIPGTKFNKCLKDQKKIMEMLRDVLKERLMSPEVHKGDLLNQICRDMDREKFLSEDFIVQLIFEGLFAAFGSVSGTLALAFKFLFEHPLVVEELKAEHEAILKNRENPSSGLTWDEYKSMNFTQHVINETLRLGHTTPGLLRRALKDIPAKGFTIPKGWTIMLVIATLHLSPETFKDPLEFNPWRWKELDSNVVLKNFKPFGGGVRQCAGAEYSRVFMATFFHVLLTKYRWRKTSMWKIYRNPVLGYGKGFHIKFSEKEDL